jgi:hypothetical protein
MGQVSRVALGIAAKVPKVAGLGVHLWAETYRWKPRKEPWFFLALRFRLQLRLRKRVRLLTGQQLYVDPYDHVGQHIVSSGCYESETVSVFQRF